MADKRIRDGATRTIAATDLVDIDDGSNPVQYKSTLEAIKDAMESGGVLELALAQAQITDLDVPSETSKETVTQAGHPFSAGDAIGRSGGAWAKAKADLTIKALAVVLSVTDANTFVAGYTGKQTITSHGLSEGLYYLSSSVAGGLTTTEPGLGAWTQEVLYALDANTVLLRIGTARG